MQRQPFGDRTIRDIKKRKVTAMRQGWGPYGDRTVPSRLLPHVRRTAAVRAPYGRCNASADFTVS